jgi:hypothetical protein
MAVIRALYTLCKQYHSTVITGSRCLTTTCLADRRGLVSHCANCGSWGRVLLCGSTHFESQPGTDFFWVLWSFQFEEEISLVEPILSQLNPLSSYCNLRFNCTSMSVCQEVSSLCFFQITFCVPYLFPYYVHILREREREREVQLFFSRNLYSNRSRLLFWQSQPRIVPQHYCSHHCCRFVTNRSSCYGCGSNQRISLRYAILFGNLWATKAGRTCWSN